MPGRNGQEVGRGKAEDALKSQKGDGTAPSAVQTSVPLGRHGRAWFREMMCMYVVHVRMCVCVYTLIHICRERIHRVRHK